MVAYLEKTDGNAEFHEIIDFLTRSSIHYALTVSPVVSTTFVEQFWMTAKSKTINNVRYITATVAGKPVSISEASIRSDLQFNDAAGIDVLPNQAIFDTIQLMGYEGDLNIVTFNKGLFSPQWKFLFHTIIHCLSSKSTSWDQIPTNIATAVICLATNQVYNFSKLIFDGMMRHLDAKKKFVMYPRVKKNSGNVTPLFPSMLAQPTEDEGAVSERPSETQPTPSPTHPSEDQSEPQPDPFLRPSSSNPIPDSIPEGSGGNHGGQSSSDRSQSGTEDDLTLQSAQIKQLKKKARPVINHHKAWIKSLSMKKRLARKKKMEYVSKQGRKTFKSIPTVHKDPAFDDLDDAMDYMETKDANDEGIVKDSVRTRVSTEDQVSTDKPNEGTTKPKDGNSGESVAPTTVFRDDETIAQFLVTMSQNKTKQKGVEIKDTDRPITTTERSILTLKPLPKIDPKDKGKKVLEEKAKSDVESEGVNEAEKKFKILANDEEIARKTRFLLRSFKKKREKSLLLSKEPSFFMIPLLHRRFLAQQRSKAIRNKLPIRNQLRNQMMTYLKYVGGYRHAQLNKKKFEEIQVMYEKVKRANENFIPIGSAKDEKLIKKMNEKVDGMDKEEVSKEPKSTKVKAKIEEPKENIRKRSGRRLKMKAPKRSKRQKTDSDHEEENQLRTFLKIVPEEEEKIDYEVLGTRYPIINWESKFYDYGHFRRELIYYRVFRADGSLRWIKTFTEMIKFFDRMDLVEIHSLVMKRFETTPPEGIDLLLWGDLRIMFESKEDDELWKNQEEWKLQSWIFYENCKVYVLRLEDGTEINMLAERRCHLTKNTLERMMNLKLTTVSDDDIVFDLLRFIEQQIDKFGGQDGNEEDL
ncbi:hypothetical protein Tco_0470999 [Tanacetum coccineum]